MGQVLSELHPENKLLKAELLNAEHWICIERAKYYTESFQDTEKEPPMIRISKALKYTFNKMTIRIEDHELLVGNRSSKLIAPPFAAERGDFSFIFKYRMKQLKEFGYHITPEDEKILFKEIFPYWQGKTIRDMKVSRFLEHNLSSQLNMSRKELKKKLKAFGLSKLMSLVIDQEENESAFKRFSKIFKLLMTLPAQLQIMKAGTQDNVIGRGRCIDTQAHIIIGYKNIFKYGFEGIQKRAQDQISQVSTEEQKNFLRSIIISCDAVHEFSNRFADKAIELANKETNQNRKKELELIATICRKVPWNSPETFYEAIQSMWFVQNAIIISYGAGSGITPGRVDQLLFPFYKHDIENNLITKEFAIRLLEEFVIKINNNVVVWPMVAGVKLNHLGADVENITIGGVKRDGEDGTNDLTYLFIDAIKNTRLATSSSFRFSKKSPTEYISKVFELYNYTNGPALYNDEITVPMLQRDGYTLEDARDHCFTGCVEPSGNGDTFGATGGTKLYLPTILDLVLNQGRTMFFGNLDTIDTGNPVEFKTFDEFMNAFYGQLEYLTKKMVEATNLRDELYTKHFNNPFISSTIDGCIENAKDMTAGGAKYNFSAMGAGGIATTADSLAAIKKFVFDEKKVTMKNLVDAIQNNYKGYEDLRLILASGPKFGNDIDYVDQIVVDIVSRFCDMCNAQKNSIGGHFKASFISYGMNVYEGALEPATPNGRFAGEPVSNSFSPSNGVEKNGPTAALKSISKVDHTKIGYGDSVNMRFPAYLLKEKKGMESLKQLILSYFKMGGFHIQFNVVDVDTLRDAQLHPENYEDLIVRVSGYSAYFTRLGKEIQDDLINRREFSQL